MQAADGYCNFKDSACLGVGCYQDSRKLKGREAMAGNRQHLPTRVVVHFDLEMCFAPQRHALFHHLNLQKCSEPGSLCAF